MSMGSHAIYVDMNLNILFPLQYQSQYITCSQYASNLNSNLACTKSQAPILILALVYVELYQCIKIPVLSCTEIQILNPNPNPIPVYKRFHFQYMSQYQVNIIISPIKFAVNKWCFSLFFCPFDQNVIYFSSYFTISSHESQSQFMCSPNSCTQFNSYLVPIPIKTQYPTPTFQSQFTYIQSSIGQSQSQSQLTELNQSQSRSSHNITQSIDLNPNPCILNPLLLSLNPNPNLSHTNIIPISIQVEHDCFTKCSCLLTSSYKFVQSI